jgi:hypothetical protein
MDPIETFEHAGRKVSIFHDDDPMSPLEWGNLATLACWHRRLRLGGEQIPCMSEEKLREHVGEDLLAVLPLYLYQHSGMSISTTPFSCRFDSGQVGWAYVTIEDAEGDVILLNQGENAWASCGREPVACWKDGCYLAVDAKGRCLIHGGPKP